MNRIAATATAIIILLYIQPVSADDWPQFRGPNRDGKSSETGLLQKWPKQGPTLLWSSDRIGTGYSSPAIANGTIYITGIIKKQGVLSAFDLKGNLKWQTNYGSEWTRSIPGVRCIPTVNDDHVYVISGTANVVCFDAKTGRQIWSVDTIETFGAKFGPWGVAESPLIDGDNMICTPGGKTATIAALNKMTGKTVWTCKIEDQKSCCCSPILINRGDRRIIVTMLEDYTVGVDAQTGKLLFKDTHAEYLQKETSINPVTPVYRDGMIYTTSGYDDGGAMLKLSADGDSIERIWTDTNLDCHHGGVVLVDGHIYGSNWYSIFDGDWVCIDWNTGKEMYTHKWICKGSIIYADGMLYCYEEEDGNLALVKPSPNKFDIVSSFAITLGKGKHWAHPAISDSVLYMRHGEVLMAYDIAQKSKSKKIFGIF